MSAWRGMGARIVLAAFSCAVVVAPLSMGIGVHEVFTRLAPAVLDSHNTGVARELERCEAEPERWSVHRQFGDVELRSHAYAMDTGRSLNPEAPPLPPSMLETLRRGEPVDTETQLGFGEGSGGGRVAVWGAGTGPCAVLLVEWRGNNGLLLSVVSWMLGLAMFLCGLAAIVSGVVAVRPLVTRIRVIAAAAGTVGSEDGYRSSGERHSDALGDVARALDRADARISADRHRLLAQQYALERHLANVAHDIRTPLASLHLALEELADDVAPSHAALRMATDDIVYVTALVENLRLASRLEDGLEVMHGNARADYRRIVERVVARFAVLGRRRGISVQAAVPDRPLWVRCDPAMAEQVLANFVQNAVLHNYEGRHVAVSLQQARSGFELVVVDDGPGVPPDVLPQLGTRTFRTDDARRRDPKGSGLGLAISAEICRRAGWSLGFEVEQPTGLRVTITGRTISMSEEEEHGPASASVKASTIPAEITRG